MGGGGGGGGVLGSDSVSPSCVPADQMIWIVNLQDSEPHRPVWSLWTAAGLWWYTAGGSCRSAVTRRVSGYCIPSIDTQKSYDHNRCRSWIKGPKPPSCLMASTDVGGTAHKYVQSPTVSDLLGSTTCAVFSTWCRSTSEPGQDHTDFSALGELSSWTRWPCPINKPWEEGEKEEEKKKNSSAFQSTTERLCSDLHEFLIKKSLKCFWCPDCAVYWFTVNAASVDMNQSIRHVVMLKGVSLMNDQRNIKSHLFRSSHSWPVGQTYVSPHSIRE